MTYLAFYFIKTPLQNQELWCCNFSERDVKFVCAAKGFWKDVVTAWAKFHFFTSQTYEEIIMQTIWFNTHIRVENKPFYLEKAMYSGMTTIQDILWENRFLTYEQVREKGIDISRLQYYSVLSAIPKHWKNIIKYATSVMEIDFTSIYFQIFELDKVCNIIYSKFITDVSLLNGRRKKWEEFLHTEIELDDL